MSAEPREVADGAGVRWSCLQAFEGLADSALAGEAARLAGGDHVTVVCTPSGGARSKRLSLPPDWRKMSDAALARAIEDGPET